MVTFPVPWFLFYKPLLHKYYLIFRQYKLLKKTLLIFYLEETSISVNGSSGHEPRQRFIIPFFQQNGQYRRG